MTKSIIKVSYLLMILTCLSFLSCKKDTATSKDKTETTSKDNTGDKNKEDSTDNSNDNTPDNGTKEDNKGEDNPKEGDNTSAEKTNGITTTAGQLSEAVKAKYGENIPNTLTISGELNGDDIEYLRKDAITIEILDLSNASIADGGEYSFTEGNKESTEASKANIIGRYMFSNMSKLVEIKLPKNITRIENNAFAESALLQSITLPESLEFIGESVFSDCKALNNIQLTANLKSIGDYSFSGCSALSNISFAEGLTSIGTYAFGDCTSLTSINLPSSLTELQKLAFANCSLLERITLPSNLSKIGIKVFKACTSLTEVHIQALTPPTIEVSRYQDPVLFPENTKIYLASASKESYMSDKNWKAAIGSRTVIGE